MIFNIITCTLALLFLVYHLVRSISAHLDKVFIGSILLIIGIISQACQTPISRLPRELNAGRHVGFHPHMTYSLGV